MPTCKYCHQEFIPTNHKGGSPQEYCSPPKRCRTKARNMRYRQRHPEGPRKWAATYYYKMHRKPKEEAA